PNVPPPVFNLSLTTGTSVSTIAEASVGGQLAQIVPVLQAQDGSFVGTVQYGDPNNPQSDMLAFDASGNVHWTVPNEQPQIATEDGGVIGQSGITYDSSGSATGQIASLPIYSWFGNAYRYGSTDQVLANPPHIALDFWALLQANHSGSRTAVKQEWFPKLDRCTTSPGCIGPNEAIYNALSDLVVRLSALSGVAQSAVFDKLGNDSNGNKLTTDSFIKYLTKQKPVFYDGLRSNFCWEALTSVIASALCSRWNIVNVITGSQSVSDYLQNPRYDRQAVSGTPSPFLITFFKPSFILLNSAGKNLGNEATIFHEALHGITGQYDISLENILTPNGPICGITTYLQDKVLKISPGLDSTTLCK
ncbi:MAG TPA: hypothetical protein VMU80_12905, partial [Bryobacteraceae bacterium]|nr:hypothetical protein [Bryobacteraceae bacterium]